MWDEFNFKGHLLQGVIVLCVLVFSSTLYALPVREIGVFERTTKMGTISTLDIHEVVVGRHERKSPYQLKTILHKLDVDSILVVVPIGNSDEDYHTDLLSALEDYLIENDFIPAGEKIFFKSDGTADP